MRGLDPRIHPLRTKVFTKMDGLPGHKRVYARLQRAMPGNDDCDCCSRLPLARLAAFAARHRLPATLCHGASLRAFTPVFEGLWTRVNALEAGRATARRACLHL